MINEERSYTEYAVVVPTTDFVVGYDFIDNGVDITEVTLNGVDPTTIGYTVLQVNNTTYRFAPPVESGVVRLSRVTDIDTMAHVFTEGAIFVSENMDGNFKQIRHSQQEVKDRFTKFTVDTNTTLQAFRNDIDATIVVADNAIANANAAATAANAASVIATQAAADIVDTNLIVQSSGEVDVVLSDTSTVPNMNKRIATKTKRQPYILEYYSDTEVYPVNARIMLANGEIVVSTVAVNTQDPNVDMTWWVFDDNTVESIADLIAINNPKDGQVVSIKGYYKPSNLALAKPYKGGGFFVFNQDKVGINDGLTIFSGWERQYESLDVTMAGAKGDGVSDDTNAVNKLSMYLYKNGGGNLVFPESSSGYRFNGTIHVVSNVHFECNGQTLIGSASLPLFKTANVVDDAFVPITVVNLSTVVRNSQINNLRARGSKVVFDFMSFTLNCSVKNVEFEVCTQGFKLLGCFYSRWENLQATSTSGTGTLPFYHLGGAANAMLFDRVSATVAWGWLIESSTALVFNACNFEGGELGYKFKGDNLGMTFTGGYYEAITGTLFDFSESGNFYGDFQANFINGVDIIFQDGGAGSLFGNWEDSNTIVSVGGSLGTPFVFRGLMNISGAKNYIKFKNSRIFNDANVLAPAENWITGKATSLSEIARWNADGIADIRAVADVYSGVIPVKFSGDFGEPYFNSVPFSVKSTLATGASVGLTIDTQLKYQPLSLFVKVVLEFRREVGGVYQYYYVYGDIYGSIFELKGGLDVNASKQVTATAVDNGGKLRIVLNNIANPNGDLAITGTVRAVS